MSSNSQLTSEQSESLHTLFNERGLTGKRRGKYLFNDGTSTSSIRSVYSKLGFPDSLEAHPCLIPLAYQYAKSKDFGAYNFLEVVKDYCQQHTRDLSIEVENGMTEDVGSSSEEARASIRELVPVILATRGEDELVLVNRKKGRVSYDVSPATYLRLRGVTIEDLTADERVLLAKPVFNPYEMNVLYSGKLSDGTTCPVVNLYAAPEWRKTNTPPAYDGPIKKIIDHLFPVAEDREYVLDWLHYAIVGRNSTVLCLVGARGTGKGILVKDIASALIGQEYAEIVGQAILEEKFNAPFKNKRLIFFDEVDISGDTQIRRFKAYCNDKIALEGKGKDSVTIDNFSSMALSSNDRKEFRVEPQERRFSVPRVTAKPLLDIMAEEEINDFVENCKNPTDENIAAFGEWLLRRKPTHSSQRPYRTDYFFELCRISMPVWRLFIIDRLSKCVDKEDIPLKELQQGFREEYREGKNTGAKFPSSRTTIQEFLFQYRHKGVITIGELVEVVDDGISIWVVRPTNEMVKDNVMEAKKKKEAMLEDKEQELGL